MRAKLAPPPWGLVLVRLATGGFLLAGGWPKLVSGSGPWLVESAAERIAGAPAPFAWWGREVLLRSPELFAQLLSWGAFVCGTLLFLGALVRPAAALALVLLVHVHFAGPLPYRELTLLLGVCALACGLSRAGRRLGCDELLDRRLPAWITWTR